MSIRKQNIGLESISSPETKLGKSKGSITGQVNVQAITPEENKGAKIAKMVGGFANAAINFKNLEKREEEQKKAEDEQNQSKIFSQMKNQVLSDQKKELLELDEMSLNQSDEENEKMFTSKLSEQEDFVVSNPNDELAKYKLNNMYNTFGQRKLKYKEQRLQQEELHNMEVESDKGIDYLLNVKGTDEDKEFGKEVLNEMTNSMKEVGISNKNITPVLFDSFNSTVEKIANATNIDDKSKIQKIKSLETIYNNSEFLGKNKSYGAKENNLNFQNTIDTIRNKINKKITTEYKVYLEEVNTNKLMTSKQYDTLIDNGVKNGVQDPVDAVKLKHKYKVEQLKFNKQKSKERVMDIKMSENKFDLLYSTSKGENKTKVKTKAFEELDDLKVNDSLTEINIFAQENPTLYSEWSSFQTKQMNSIDEVNTQLSYYNKIKDNKIITTSMSSEDKLTMEYFRMKGVPQDEEKLISTLKVLRNKMPSDVELKRNGVVLDTSSYISFANENNIPLNERQEGFKTFKKLLYLNENNEELTIEMLNKNKGDYVINNDKKFIGYTQSELAKKGYTFDDIEDGLSEINYDLKDDDIVKFKDNKIIISNSGITTNIIQGETLVKLEDSMKSDITNDRNYKIRSEVNKNKENKQDFIKVAVKENIIKVQKQIEKNIVDRDIIKKALDNPTKMDEIEGITNEVKEAVSLITDLKDKNNLEFKNAANDLDYNNLKAKLILDTAEDEGITLFGKTLFKTTVSEKIKKNQIDFFETQGFIDLDTFNNDDIEDEERKRIQKLKPQEKESVIDMLIQYEKDGDISLHKDDLNWLIEEKNKKGN